MLRSAVLVLIVLIGAGCGGAQRKSATPVLAKSSIPPSTSAPVMKPAKKSKKGSKEEPAVAPMVVRPSGPDLPAGLGRDTTPEQLAAHALIVAREEVDSGTAGAASVLARRDFLIALWTPQLAQRQAVETAIQAERAQSAQRQIEQAARLNEQETKLQAVERDYAQRLARERLRTAAIDTH